MQISHPLTTERYDVFEVQQVTRNTSLESSVAVDIVSVSAGETSQSHRHNRSDTILLILEGSGQVRVGKRLYDVCKGDRIHIPPAAFHQVITSQQPLQFLSIQLPPILIKGEDKLDLETENEESL